MDSVALTERLYTVAEYLELEEQSETKHDYFNGRILDMSGGTLDHSSITVNLTAAFHGSLRGKPCRIFGSDMRVQAHRSTLYTYPDVSVICGEPEYAEVDSKRTTITNPRVVVEVLSPSTEAWDRGEKFNRYVGLQSLEEYILVSQHRPRIESFRRDTDGTWRFSRVEGIDAVLHVRCVDITVPLSDVYLHVDFEPLPE